MFDLSSINSNESISYYWDIFYKNVNHDKVFLYFFENNELKPFTYKELNAKAHCLAAYFIKAGINQEDKILIITDNHPNFLIVDLACQIIGIPNLSLPINFENTKLQNILQSFKPKFLFFNDYNLYLNAQPILKDYNIFTILFEQHFQKIAEYANIVLLDTAIEIGKVYWRENQLTISELKNSVNPVKAKIYLNIHNHFNQSDFLQNLKKISKVYFHPNYNPPHNILITSLPYHILYRYHIYLALLSYHTIYLGSPKVITSKLIRTYNIHHWIASQKDFHDCTNKWFTKNKKGFNGIAISNKKKLLVLKTQNKNLPFGLKIKSNITSFQRTLLKYQWGKLSTIHILEHEIDIEDLLLWNTMNIPLLSYLINNHAQIIQHRLLDINSNNQLPSFHSSNTFQENFF